MTQDEVILRHLESYGSITSMDAFQKYGVTRLSAVIFRLKKNNKIVSHRESTKNRFGGNSNYCRYEYKGKYEQVQKQES